MKKLKDDELKKVDGGSTKITVNSQTFGSSGGADKRHTISSSFNTSSSKNISKSARRN